MKNKKLLMVGAVAVLGFLAYKLYAKPKKNDDGFYNATGKTGKMAFPGQCARCRTADGGLYVPPSGYTCNYRAGERCLTSLE
jgi:hypothetical protein